MSVINTQPPYDSLQAQLVEEIGHYQPARISAILRARWNVSLNDLEIFYLSGTTND